LRLSEECRTARTPEDAVAAARPPAGAGAESVREWLRHVLLEEFALARPSAVTIGRHWATLLNDVFEVRLDRGAGEERLFAKAARPAGDPEGLRLEAERTETVRELMRGAGDRATVSEVVAYRPTQNVLVVRAAQGQSLLAEIQRTCGWRSTNAGLENVVAWAAAVGGWVRHLEDASKANYDESEVAERLASSARAAGERIRLLKVFSSRSWDAVIQRLVDAVERLCLTKPLTTCMTHGDLHPGNVFLTDDAAPIVTAIDLRLAEARIVGYDALYFDHQVRYSLSRLRLRPGHVSAVLRSFWLGYDDTLSDSTVRGLRALFELYSLRYLSTLARDAHLPKRVQCRLEAWMIARGVASRTTPR
jgi:hypothetical protein